MILNDYITKSGEFLRRTSETNQPASFHEESAALKKALAEGDKPRIRYPLTDVLFLLMELAAVSGASLNKEWAARNGRQVRYESGNTSNWRTNDGTDCRGPY